MSGMSDDPQLKSLLDEWTAPAAPASLEVRLQRARTPWYWRMMTASVPIPVAVAFSLALAFGVWQASSKPWVSCSSLTPSAQKNCTSGREC